MSESMIERAALAIALHEMKANGHADLAKLATFNAEAQAIATAEAVETYGGQARAAIEAMREPTNDMQLHGGMVEVEPQEDRYTQDIGSYHAAQVWREMIDAALTPPQTPTSPEA